MTALRYETAESGREILDLLYDTTGFFKCTIRIPVREPDRVTDTELPLYIEALGQSDPHTYQLANGDRIYRTSARLDVNGESFPVDVIIRYHGTRIERAVISVSEQANKVAERLEQTQ